MFSSVTKCPVCNAILRKALRRVIMFKSQPSYQFIFSSKSSNFLIYVFDLDLSPLIVRNNRFLLIPLFTLLSFLTKFHFMYFYTLQLWSNIQKNVHFMQAIWEFSCIKNLSRYDRQWYHVAKNRCLVENEGIFASLQQFLHGLRYAIDLILST